MSDEKIIRLIEENGKMYLSCKEKRGEKTKVCPFGLPEHLAKQLRPIIARGFRAIDAAFLAEQQ